MKIRNMIPTLALWALASLCSSSVLAQTIGPWTPRFKGVDYMSSTNIPGSGRFTFRQVVHALRIDLTDPDIVLYSTPRITGYEAGSREVAGYTVSDFLRNNKLQVAINAGYFNPGSYYLPAGTAMNIRGLSISKGVLVSSADTSAYASTLRIDENNVPVIIPNDWPAAPLDGVYTAIAGSDPLVVNGQNVRSRDINNVEPRTLYGISEDKRYLYLVALDGRQPGYSDGAGLWESAEWMLLIGAYDAINADGGGSTTMVIQNTTGTPLRLNRSSAVADSGRERTVGSHFGLFAKPVPGFINDIVVLPSDESATVTWNTAEPASSEVRYGTTIALGSTTGISPTLVTEHTLQLTGLNPDTGYYLRVASKNAAGNEHLSPVLFFTTTNFVSTNQVFSVSHPWKYTSTAQPADWRTTAYDDSSWSDPAPGNLWVDTRATGPHPDVPFRATQMPANGDYPFITYYFRSRFTLEEMRPGSSLLFQGYIDDGAAFYLNGVEIFRLRLPAGAGPNTLANAYPCGGDSTCLDEFTIKMESLPSAVIGENVLAVEVHNYNARSNDITFGLNLSRIDPVPKDIRLEIDQVEGQITLVWIGTGLVLQSAPALEGPWENVTGAASPYRIQDAQGHQFFRLKR